MTAPPARAASVPTAGILPPRPGPEAAPVGGILLTGGASARMGRDKATMRIAGESNARRIATLLGRLVHPVVEVGPAVSGLLSVREEPEGGGPLVAVACGGRALRSLGHHGAALVLACDLPFVDEAVLTFLAERPGANSVVPTVDGRPQPLCARWSAEDLLAAADYAAAGERAVRALAFDPAERPGEAEWSAVATARTFADVDTPEDLARLGIGFAEAFE